MSKRRKIRLFKNDPFGIKYKMFDVVMHYYFKKIVKNRTKALALYLDTVNIIGIPKDDKEKEVLKDVINRYDNTIQKLEEDMKYPRMYIEEESS